MDHTNNNSDTKKLVSSWDLVEMEEDGKGSKFKFDEDDIIPLERQENVFIRGHDARNLMMQKLSRPTHG